MGATLALGELRCDRGLRFLGLSAWPEIDPAGRVHAYRVELDGEAFRPVCALTVKACEGLERLVGEQYDENGRSRFLTALMSMTLVIFASDEGPAHFEDALASGTRRVC